MISVLVRLSTLTVPRGGSSCLTMPVTFFTLGVVHGLELDHQVLELLLGAALLEAHLLLLAEDVGRGDAQHVADPHEAEALGQQDDVESLVPGHVHQADRHVARHLVAGDHVEVGDLGDQAQHVGDLDVLEVEGDAAARVLLAVDQPALLEDVDRRRRLERGRCGAPSVGDRGAAASGAAPQRQPAVPATGAGAAAVRPGRLRRRPSRLDRLSSTGGVAATPPSRGKSTTSSEPRREISGFRSAARFTTTRTSEASRRRAGRTR